MNNKTSKHKLKKLAEHEDGTVIYKEETRTIDYETKARLYREGNYSCKLSIPVNHTMWNNNSWINWTDKTGRWWLDGCYWEKIEGEIDQYKSCASSGFITRWNKAKDDHITKGKETEARDTCPSSDQTIEAIEALIKNTK